MKTTDPWKVRIRNVSLVAAVACSMGCATSLVLASDDSLVPMCVSHTIPHILAGTALDAKVAVNSKDYAYSSQVPIPWSWRVLAVIDIPLSLAADTAMLPITVPLQISEAVVCSRPAPPEEKKIIHKEGEDVPIEGGE